MPGWFRNIFGKGVPRDGGGDAPPPTPPAATSPNPGPDHWWTAEFPEWGGVMKTHDRFARFMNAVERYFSRRGMTPEYARDGVLLLPAGSAIIGQLGLANLIQSCAQRPDDEFPGLVAAHFDAVSRSQAQQAEYEAKLKDFAFAAPRLRVRLWDGEELVIDSRIASREDIPGLTTTLVVDLPEAIRSVRRDEVQGWGRDEAELFRTARDNVIREVNAEVKPLDPSRPDGLQIIEADSFYTASAALDADRVPGLTGEHGVFVSMPVRHGMLAWRFNSPEDLEGVELLIRATRLLFEEGPGSLSRRVYWHRDGRWCEIAYESGEDHVTIIPPPELVAYIEGLRED